MAAVFEVKKRFFTMNTKRNISCILLFASCFLHLAKNLYALELQTSRSELRTPNSRWSEPVTIDAGPSNAYRTDIAFDKSGNAIAVFEQRNGDIYRIFANRFINGKGWQKPVAIDTGAGNAYRAQVAFDKEGNAIAVFKQEVAGGRYRVFANRYIYNEGWQGHIPIDSDTDMVDGHDIVFDSEGNAAAVFEAKDGEEFGIYVNFYRPSSLAPHNEGVWSGAFRIDRGPGNAYFPCPLFDDKGNLYIIYYKEESGGFEVYVSRFERGGNILTTVSLDKVETIPLVPFNKGERVSPFPLNEGGFRRSFKGEYLKKEEWFGKKGNKVVRGSKSVYNSVFLKEKERIYGRETHSKLEGKYRNAYKPTLLVKKNGEVFALFARWDGEYLSGYVANYRNGKWEKPEEIDIGKGDVEYIRGAVNSEGGMAVVFTQWVDGNLRIHARIKNSVSDSVGVRKGNTDAHTYPDTSSGWGDVKIIDAGEKDGYNPNVAFTESGEIVVVWCQWEKINVKFYANIYKKGIGWGNAERLDNGDGETCGAKIASGMGGRVIAIFEQEGIYNQDELTNRIFAVEFISQELRVESQEAKN